MTDDQNDEKFRYIYSQKAKNFLSSLLYKQKIKYHYFKKDFYKRNLIIPFVDSKNVCFELLKKGFARVEYISDNPKEYFYYPDKIFYKDLIKIQNEAKKAQVGF